MKYKHLHLPLFILLTFLTPKSQAQTTLYAGDIAIYGWNSYTYKIDFVTLVNMAAGTAVKITDLGWNSSTNAFTTVLTTDGSITWTLGSSVAKGSLFTLTLKGSAGSPNLINNTTGIDISSELSQSGFTAGTIPMTATGDGVFIYQGPSSNPVFVFGFNNSNSTNAGILANGWNSSIAITLRDSQLPNGAGSQNSLTDGTNAIGMVQSGNPFYRNVQYNGPTTNANATDWLSRIANRNNWTGDNSSPGSSSSSIAHSSVGSTLNLNVSLPLTLLSFSGKTTAQGNLLTWTTTDEVDVASFDVERSIDGLNFSVQGTVAAGKRQYSFTDRSVTSTEFYRLKMIDLDGKFRYSNVISLTAGATPDNYSISPNPLTGGILTIRVKSNTDAKIDVRIADISGKNFYAGSVNAATLNAGGAAINVASLPAGLYILQIHNAATGASSTFKFNKK